MKVFLIGGTGLLGSEAARILLERGHQVLSLALPPLPEGSLVPQGMELQLGSYTDMTDQQLLDMMQGCDVFMFAAGMDERVEHAPPIYDFYAKHNIEPLKRMLPLAKQAGIIRAVICGSYFAHFARIWPQHQLTRWHPYIRSRIDQEEVALTFSDEHFDVAVLQLPYIFGTQPGRKPVWVFLVKILLGMKGATFYPPGGTTMVTVRQVGEAMAGAAERAKGAQLYPIGWFNLTWKQMFAIFHKYMGMPGRRVITVPKWMFALVARKLLRDQQRNNIEGGLHLPRFTQMMSAELFIDKSLGCEPLGVTDDDIDAAIGDSVRLSLEAIKDSQRKLVDMQWS